MNSCQFFELIKHVQTKIHKGFPTIQIEEDYDKLTFSHPSFTLIIYTGIEFDWKTLCFRGELEDMVENDEDILVELENTFYQTMYEYIENKGYNVFIDIEHSDYFERTLFHPENEERISKSFFSMGPRGKQAFHLLSHLQYIELSDGQFEYTGKNVLDEPYIIIPNVSHGCLDIYYPESKKFDSYRCEEHSKLLTLFTEEETKQWVSKLEKEYEQVQAFQKMIQEKILEQFPEHISISEEGKLKIVKRFVKPIIKRTFNDEFFGYTWHDNHVRFTKLDDSAIEEVFIYIQNLIKEEELKNKILTSLYHFDPYSFIMNTSYSGNIYFLGEERYFNFNMSYETRNKLFYLTLNIENMRISKLGSPEELLEEVSVQLKNDFGGDRLTALFGKNKPLHSTKWFFETSGKLLRYRSTNPEQEEDLKKHYLNLYGNTCPILHAKSKPETKTAEYLGKLNL